MIELNLDLSDLETDAAKDKKNQEELKKQEIEKISYFKDLAYKYQEQLVLTYAKS